MISINWMIDLRISFNTRTLQQLETCFQTSLQIEYYALWSHSHWYDTWYLKIWRVKSTIYGETLQLMLTSIAHNKKCDDHYSLFWPKSNETSPKVYSFYKSTTPFHLELIAWTNHALWKYTFPRFLSKSSQPFRGYHKAFPLRTVQNVGE